MAEVPSPRLFHGGLLNSQPLGFYAPAQLVADAKRQGVEVRPVEINASDWDCTLEPIPAEPYPHQTNLVARRHREAQQMHSRFGSGCATFGVCHNEWPKPSCKFAKRLPMSHKPVLPSVREFDARIWRSWPRRMYFVRSEPIVEQRFGMDCPRENRRRSMINTKIRNRPRIFLE